MVTQCPSCDSVMEKKEGKLVCLKCEEGKEENIIEVNGKKYKVVTAKEGVSCEGCAACIGNHTKNLNICLSFPECEGIIFKEIK